MRPQGRFTVNRLQPRARGVCDRCGFHYNHADLRWQYQWQGPRLQNLRILVCESCLDKPQPGLRTILIPPDPLPIQNPRPEAYTLDDNPIAGVGASALLIVNGGNPAPSVRGNMLQNGGILAAYDGNTNKSWVQSAATTAQFGRLNTFWNQAPSGNTTSLAYSIANFKAYAPFDVPFFRLGSTTINFYGSNDGNNTLTLLFSGPTAGTPGEVFTGNTTGGTYSSYRFEIVGDGVNWVSVAQLQVNVSGNNANNNSQN